MTDIEIVGPRSSYRCTCPPTDDMEEEIVMAMACAEREAEHDRRIEALMVEE